MGNAVLTIADDLLWDNVMVTCCKNPTSHRQTKNAIRGREQQNIKKHGGAKSEGGTSGNAINSVGPKNKNARKYEKAAKKGFGN